jgi:hypothetical protein
VSNIEKVGTKLLKERISNMGSS